MIKRAKDLLKSVFGYDRFISLQQDVIESVLNGRDCLAVMPTGGGKSLCYQIPALIFDGLTVVVSPLIALMKDQVAQLAQVEIPAVLLNSSISPESYRQSVQRVRRGDAKLLYVAPETLLKPNLLALFDSVPIACVAIDEAHCISEWGPDFRPEYRKLAEARARMPRAVCIALTATATPRVRKDIKSSLGIDDSNEFVASFNRENLFFRVVSKERPVHQAVELLRKYPNDPGIIYCSTRKQVDDLCAALRTQGFSVCPYHAGLSDSERDRNQEGFVRDEVRIIVATVAFGMGIDKSNVRFILHYDLPKNIESYYQEIGRAGRDGMRAECVMLFSYADIHKIKYFINQKAGTAKRAANLQLSAMLQFAESDVCRRIPLLGYFGETFSQDKCGRCDNCLAGERVMRDITIPAQKFLSCVKRTGERFGVMHIIDVLLGSKASKVFKFGHERLSTYGIGTELSRRQWQQVARQLLHKGFMMQDPDIGRLSLSPMAWDVFGGRETVLGRLDHSEEPEKPPDETTRVAEDGYDSQLFEALRQKRKELAHGANVPPYVVFADKTLAEMASYLPRTAESMLQIHGVGRAKLEKYGSFFLKVIEDHCRDHPVEVEPACPPRRVQQRRGPVRKMRELAAGEAFNSGKSVATLAQEFDIKESTVLEYLLSYCQEGHSLRSDGFLPLITLSGHPLKKALEVFEELGPDLLKPIFDALNGGIGYEDLKIIRLYYLSLRDSSSGGEDCVSGKQPYARKIVCLANSRKYSGRCIAGKEVIDSGGVGAWIRPVSGKTTGELSPNDIMLPNGNTPRLLDIITVPLHEASPHAYQSENHLIGGGRWGWSGTWEVSRMGELCDDVDRLWINGYHSSNGLNDRIPFELAEKTVSSSLLLIRPTRLSITVEQGPRGLNRVQARFSFKGETYRLIVTDPQVEACYLAEDFSDYPVDCPQPCMTVSISEPFEGFCYKLVAALIL